MHKNITLNVKEIRSKSSELINSLRENGEKVLLILLFIIGIRLGALIFSNNYQITEYAVRAFDFVLDAKFKDVFLILSAINTATVLAIFIGGFSACGLPTSLGLPCVYGIFCGIASCCAYNIYKINGVFFSLILIVPFSVLVSMVLIVISNDSIRLSKQIIKSIGFGDVTGRGEVKVFLIKGIAAVAITLITSLIQSLLVTKIGEKILNI